MMYELPISTVHLEITDKCNAACPQCARNYHGSSVLRPGVGSRELSLQDVKKIFPPSFLRNLDGLYVNGNLGDASVAKDTLEIFTYLRLHNPPMCVTFLTNGHARAPEWWRQLVGLVDQIDFALDGLADTHSIYRKNLNFNRILANAAAFIDGGGRAHWVMTVFEHNEHQVRECEELAEKLRFQSFVARKSGRFQWGERLLDKTPVLSRDGETVEYFLRPPRSETHRNPAYDDNEGKPLEVVDQANAKRQYNYELWELRLMKNGATKAADYIKPSWLDQVRIDCPVKRKREIFVDAAGRVFPCCFLGLLSTGYSIQTFEFFRERGLTLDELNAKHKSIEEIVQSEFFAFIESGWEKPSCREGKHLHCARNCGVKSGTSYEMDDRYVRRFW